MAVTRVRAADLPQYVPYTVGTTSDGLGWRGLRAELVRGHAPGELHLPPLDHHLLNLIVAVPNRHEHRWDGRSRLETAHPGAASLVPAGSPSYWQWHYVEAGSPCDFHLHFEPTFVRRVAMAALDELPQDAEFHGELCFTDPEVHALGLGLLRAVEDRGLRGALYAESLAVALVSALLTRQQTWRNSARRPARGGEISVAAMHRVCDFIEAHLDGDLHLEQMAAVVGLGPDRFARVFRSVVGESPYHFVLGRRIERARQLLRNTALPLAEIALSLGFADQAHFSTTFRRRTGHTPSAFRRETQG